MNLFWSGVLQIALLSTPNPSEKISEFFAHFPPIGTILSQIGSDIKEFHGFIDVVEGTTGQQGKVFDKYKSSYAVCSDVIMVASLFVGVGELVAISKGAKVSTVVRASVKSTILAPGKALKDIVSLTTKTMAKIDGIALVILEKMVENNTLVKFLQFDGAKAYLMNKQLNVSIRATPYCPIDIDLIILVKNKKCKEGTKRNRLPLGFKNGSCQVNRQKNSV